MLESFSYAKRMAERGTPSDTVASPSIAIAWACPASGVAASSHAAFGWNGCGGGLSGYRISARERADQIRNVVGNCYTERSSSNSAQVTFISLGMLPGPAGGGCVEPDLSSTPPASRVRIETE